ncbi:class I SAM-dependent methyltransferase [Streptomyces sp. NPDC020807]|uniref:class I SAM-dependent methyltransferase n=1 Tax=Streptomyces sp. NPDC020807 TaxID=3155119 RepID=UPI0033CE3D08
MTASARNHQPEGLFTSLAADYGRHRPGIPAGPVALLADAVREVARPVLLDLGTGTGQVPVALLPAVPRLARVDLVDADADMLREAAAALAPLPDGSPAGFHHALAQDFTPPYEGYRADLITCARAFHWMPRADVLAMADRVAAPGATVAVMGDGSLWTCAAPWATELKRLIQSHLGAERRAGPTGVYGGPKRSYQDDLAESAFARVTEHRFPVRRTWTPDGVVAHLRSTSFARADLFEDRHARFEDEALTLLERHHVTGGLIENAVFEVLLARRPRGGR